MKLYLTSVCLESCRSALNKKVEIYFTGVSFIIRTEKEITLQVRCLKSILKSSVFGPLILLKIPYASGRLLSERISQPVMEETPYFSPQLAGTYG